MIKEAGKLVELACKQLETGLKAKRQRMTIVSEIVDLYNNKILKLDDNVCNIPFPIMANQIDDRFSKIDNAPRVTFKLPNKKLLSEKIAAAWEQEKSSMKAGWNRKDRAEKKLACLSGRGIAKIYASSVKNQYKSHYDLVDFYSFVADPTRGHLDEGIYHGETDIFKTKATLKKMAEMGIYDKAAVERLINRASDEQPSGEVAQNKFNRLKALDVDVETGAFSGQEGVFLTEWIMKYSDEKFYLFFDPQSKVAVRAERLKDVFKNNITPYVSWATNYDEFSFWTKGEGDDIYPVAEAMRLVLNTALENEKRRNRPMRIVEAGSLVDVNELMDYVPDNVILTNRGSNPNIITVETPEITTSINLVEFLNNFLTEKTGSSGAGVNDKDVKVGVYYGQLQQEADRIGIINKSYSESYSEKGYRFFWGLKEHLTGSKPVEMLGKGGVRLEELKSIELSDVGDVDDVIVSGGQAEEELNAIKDRQQNDVLASLTGNPVFSQMINPKWAIKTSMKKAGFNDDDINEALETQTDVNQELMEEADEAIAMVLEGKTPKLNMGATVNFMQRILDYVRDNLDYIKLDKNGKVKGVDKKIKEQSDRLLAYAMAHQEVILSNVRRDANQQIQMQQREASNKGIEMSNPNQQDQQMALARPFENAQGTPEGTAEASQMMTQMQV